MRPNILRALALSAMLLIPASAMAQSGSGNQNSPGPGMMWGGQGMMGGGQGNGYGNGYGYGPGMMGGGMMRGCPMMGGMMQGRGFQQSASAWLDGQLAYAHSELGITAAQEPVWKGYADAVHARSEAMISAHQSMMGAMWGGDLPFNEAYDLHIQVMESHLDAMKANRDAAMKLFDALTPEQQKKASWVLPQSMCMM